MFCPEMCACMADYYIYSHDRVRVLCSLSCVAVCSECKGTYGTILRPDKYHTTGGIDRFAEWLKHSAKILPSRWDRPFCRVAEALGKDFTKCRTRQRGLGKQYIDKEGSVNSTSTKPFFCRVLFLGHSAQTLSSARQYSAKKSRRHDAGVTEMTSLPSVF
jgi:hypothetical protein